MTNKYQLKLRQICFIFIAFFPISKIFLMPALMAGASREDMWISALLNVILDTLTVVILAIACKKCNKTFFEIMDETFKGGAKVIYAIYMLFFIFKAIIPIIEEKTYVDITLYEAYPNYLMFLPFFIFSVIVCCKKLTAVGRVGDLTLIYTLFGFLFIFGLSITNCDISALLPMGANGFNRIISGSKIGVTWFGDAVYLMFFIGQFKMEKKGVFKLTISFVISCLIVIIFLIIFYTTFTSIAFRQIFSLTDISRYATVINNIARFDYLAIFAILFTGIFSLALPLFFATLLLRKIFNFKSKVIPSVIVNGVVFLIITIFSTYYATIENIIINYCYIPFLILQNLFPIVFAFFVIKEKKYEYAKN